MSKDYISKQVPYITREFNILGVILWDEEYNCT